MFATKKACARSPPLFRFTSKSRKHNFPKKNSLKCFRYLNALNTTQVTFYVNKSFRQLPAKHSLYFLLVQIQKNNRTMSISSNIHRHTSSVDSAHFFVFRQKNHDHRRAAKKQKNVVVATIPRPTTD